MQINKRSTTKLTDAQTDFFKYMRIRATDQSVGQPYIAPALFKLTPVNATGLRTMAVDRFWRVYIDFDYFMAHPDPIVYAASFFAHEPWHLLRDHEARFRELAGDIRDKNSTGWNVAGDLEINDDIAKLVPKEGCFPETGEFIDFEKHKSAEYYYGLLMKNPKILDKFQPPKPECTCDDKKQGKGQNGQQQPQQGNQSGQQQGGQQDGGQQPGGQQGQGQQPGQGNQPGQGQGNQPGQSGQGGQGNQPGQGQGGQQPGQGQGQGNQPGDQQGQGGQGNQPGQGSGQDDHQHGDGSGSCPIHDPKQVIGCGSGAGTDLSEWELDYDPENSLDDEGHESMKRQIAENIKQQERSKPGTVPGWAQDWAGEILAHKPVDWRQALRAQVKQAINVERIRKQDYSPRRPKRRQPIPDVILPGMHAPKPNVLLGFDTSGSNMHNMGVILDEVCNIVRQTGVRGKEFRSFAVDVDVDKIIPVRDPRKVLENRRMNGGTLMRPAYELAAKQKGILRPACFILMTDGEVFDNDFPTEVPPGGNGIKFITCIITAKDSSYGKKTFEDAQARLGSWGTVLHIETE